MHFYGECYGRTQSEIDEALSSSHNEDKCVGDQTYTKCDKSKHDHCTGKDWAEGIYTFKSKTAEESKYKAVRVLGLSYFREYYFSLYFSKIVCLFHTSDTTTAISSTTETSANGGKYYMIP